MTSQNFDIAILGGGPGGYTAAIRASQLGMSVGLIEKEFLGGTCLNIGCIPSKALIHSVNLYEETKGAKMVGVNISDVSIDWSAIQKYRSRCVIKLRKGVESLMQKNKIEVFTGHGILKTAATIDVDGTSIHANHIILAMGSYARSLPTFPVDGVKVINSTHGLELASLPSKLLIIGAGAIGCEFAYIMSSMGVEVNMVEYLHCAIPMEDQDVSAEYENALKKRKIKLYVCSSVISVEPNSSGVVAKVKPNSSDEEFTIEADKVLVSVGRGPNTENCGLEEAGIPMEHGFIKVDEYKRTGVGNVRAIGDCTGGLMLAHKASAEGILAVESIAGRNPKPLVMENIPRATYSKPEVGSVGLNESHAREKFGDSVKSFKYPFAGIGKAVVEGDTAGFAKLIAAGSDGKLVGAHIIGPHATDLIAVATTAIGLGATCEQFAHIVQAHPTLSEIWPEAAHGLIDGAINI